MALSTIMMQLRKTSQFFGAALRAGIGPEHKGAAPFCRSTSAGDTAARQDRRRPRRHCLFFSKGPDRDRGPATSCNLSISPAWLRRLP